MTAEREMPHTTSTSTPEGWSWGLHDASRPRRATEHITRSDVTPAFPGQLGPSDAPSDSEWTLAGEIPVIVMDSLDAYWVFERVINKLHGFGRTKEEAKGELVGKLGGHLTLLASLESPKMAPRLKLELEFLKALMRPVQAPGP